MLRVLAALATKPLEGPRAGRRADPGARARSRAQARANAAKVFVDGVIEAHTAALLEPYVGSSDRGPLNFTPQALNALVQALDDASFTVRFRHRRPRRAGRAGQRGGLGGTDLRPSIAHLELTDPADLRASPSWARGQHPAALGDRDEDIKELTEPVIGPERAARLYNFGSMRNAGALLAGGSDWPVSGLSPLEGIQVAITRRALNAGPGEGPAAELLTLQEALEAYTINGAYARLQEDVTGSPRWGSWPTWSFWSATSSRCRRARSARCACCERSWRARGLYGPLTLNCSGLQ